VIPDWKRFAGLMLAKIVVILLVLTGQPLVLYPLAILSGLGVLLLLTLAYALIALQVLKREGAAESYRDLFLPALMGFGLALMQVGAIDLLRYLATGTWNGFQI
jgi:hypothetical protein